MRKMKDSGIEWIGEIPEDWKLNKISAIYSERNIKVSDKEFQPLSVTKSGILPQLENAAKTNNGDSRKLIKKNDFVINSRSDRRGSCGISEYDGSCSLINIVLKPFKNIFNKYYSYVFRSDLFADEFYRWGHGIVDDLWSTKWSEMKRIYIPEPTLNEQIRIANFLDEKCALIDRLVERHQEVIEKLKAYRQSVISEAVTQGLDPNAPMKDSGIPWIGKIPEDWKIDKIKYISKFNPGCSRHFDRHESVGYLPMECLKHGYMTPLKTEYEKITGALTCFEDGDIVLAKVTPCFENGNIAIAHNLENHTGFGSSELFVFRCSEYEPRFLFYIFQNSNFMNECISTMTGTGGLKRVSSDFIRNCRIPVPDLQLQQQIANFLDEKCAKIDRIIQDKEQIIAKLAEYKKSIIYEYVTGKKRGTCIMKIERGGIINDFIQPNRKQYAIPVYQRNYEWSREQCIRLFEDIVAAHKNDRYHFTGSIVYAPLKTENKIDTFIVIDGQQRLTTIYILIKALIDMAESEHDRNALESVVFNEDKFKQYQIDESSKLKLKPVKSDNRQLMLLMENRIDEIDKSSGIYRNYALFRELIEKALQADDQLGVAHIFDGIEHLTCASIKLDPDDNAQEIFERINSTGIPLSLADKIRNFVLMTDTDQERLYEDYWLATENLVGYNWLTAFFMDYLNIKVDYFPREDQAYETFKQVFKKNACTNKSMLEEILHYARFYHAFLYGDPQYSVSVNDTLAALRRLNQTTVYLFLFRVFDDYHNGVIDQTILEKVLSFLLNYSIRRMMCEVPSNSLRGMYKTLHNRIFNRAENKVHYYDAIVSFFRQVSSRDAWIDDRTFSDALIHNNLYRKNALCKYLLSAIENDGKEQIVTDNLTIEHVMPQNKKLSSEWQKMLGENWETVQERYLHTLGNLTLTGYNSELGDRPFAEKKKHFSDVNSKTVALNRFICQCDSWNAEMIETRATELASFILKQFPDEVPETVISFADPRYQLYSCDDPKTATFKVPNYYELFGERVNVTTYAEMLRSVIERLYALDSGIIENMAKFNDILENGPQLVMFSYDKALLRRKSFQLEGTDIYENAGFSAETIMLIIRALLDKYGIDRGDFTYSARQDNDVKGR